MPSNFDDEFHHNQQKTLIEFYERLYAGTEKHDSPDNSRIEMMRTIVSEVKGVKEADPTLLILDIGSGKQSLERQLISAHRAKSFIKKLHFITIDIAEIDANKLLMAKNKHVDHVQTSGLALPFGEKSFDLVVSNHAIDFLPREAFSQAFFVLKEKGKVIFFFHHPNMIKDSALEKNPHIREFWSYLEENSHLFRTDEEIKECLEAIGFKDIEVNLNTDENDIWWQVTAVK